MKKTALKVSALVLAAALVTGCANTAEILSTPPYLFAAAISRLAARFGVDAFTSPGISLSGTISVNPSEHNSTTSPLINCIGGKTSTRTSGRTRKRTTKRTKRGAGRTAAGKRRGRK